MLYLFTLLVLATLCSCERLHPHRPQESVNFLQYNAFMYPETVFSQDSQTERAMLIADEIGDLDTTHHFDIISFNELFDENVIAILDEELCDIGFCHHSDILTDATVDAYGIQPQIPGFPLPFIYPTGVRIYSKYRIDPSSNKHFIYSISTGEDVIANKGCVYVKVRKGRRWIHVFATHLQAGRTATKQAIKEVQLNEMKSFMDSFDKNDKDLTVMLGDFNTDADRDTEFYPLLLNILDVQELDIGDHSLNDTTSTDMDFRFINQEKSAGNWLDHVFVPNINSSLNIECDQIDFDRSYMEAIRISNFEGYNISTIIDYDYESVPQYPLPVPVYGYNIIVHDLSNHNGLYAQVVFKHKPLPAPQPRFKSETSSSSLSV